MKLDITKDIISLFTSAFIVDFIFNIILRYFLGKPINDWYDKFTISAVFADVFSIVIGIILAYIIYTKLIKKPEQEFDLGIFLGITILVQVIHDLVFYFGIVKQLPRGHNKMIDVFLEYGQYGGIGILFIDAVMMILTVLTFYVMTNYFDEVSKLLSFAVVFYALQYIIYTPRQKLPQYEKIS
jgi:hypothetical protein